MRKALRISIFSLLALAPFQSALAQALPAARVVGKASDAGDSKRSNIPVAAPETSTPAQAGEKSNPAVNQSHSAPPTTLSSNQTTSAGTNSVTRSGNVETPATTDALPLTDIYKVGVGDVLDIRLLNSTANRSTLYSVIEGGMIDFPLAGGPLTVSGLTTKEIQARITSELKRLAVEAGTQVVVGVRQYASHTVTITGLIGSPGTKSLRREAVPFYVLLAEVQPRLDAGRAVIMRAGTPTQFIDLSDSAALSFIIRPGDVINLTARPQEFYYIAGRISYPGQKVFQPGITLIQAILAAGGLARDKVDLSRAGLDGRLATTSFNLKEIKSGKVQDPKLQAGDRIEVFH